MLFICLCSGLVALLLGEPSGDRHVTQDFFPLKPGAVAHYHASSIPLAGRGDFDSTWTFEGDKNDGKITKSAQAGDGRQVDTTVYRHRFRRGLLNRGVVEVGIEGPTVEWKPVLKIGAKEGDSWVFKHSNGGTSKFTVKAFETCKLPVDDTERVCVVIQEEYSNGGVERYTEVTYARGVGVILDVDFSVKGGKRQRNNEVKLVCDKGDLTPAERAFFK